MAGGMVDDVAVGVTVEDGLALPLRGRRLDFLRRGGGPRQSTVILIRWPAPAV